MLTQLLQINPSLSSARQAFDVILKNLLKAGYPDVFDESVDGLVVRVGVLPEIYIPIYKALGVPIASEREQFIIHWDNFDVEGLDTLYKQDPNILWVVLKHFIPIRTVAFSIDTVRTAQISPKEKMCAYLAIALAFQAGSALSVEQVMSSWLHDTMNLRIGASVTRIGVVTSKNAGDIIKTTSVSEALHWVCQMACKACVIAREHVECSRMVISAFQPTRDWTTWKSMIETPVNLGDWVVKTGILTNKASGEHYIRAFQTILQPIYDADAYDEFEVMRVHTTPQLMSDGDDELQVINFHIVEEPTTPNVVQTSFVSAVKNGIRNTLFGGSDETVPLNQSRFDSLNQTYG